MDKIFYNTDEAATYKTVEGWVSRDGQFWGKGDQAEHMARYKGSTHGRCSTCDAVIDKRLVRCQSCSENLKDKRHRERRSLKWDHESPLYSDKLDAYYFDIDQIKKVMEESGMSWVQLRILICEPVKAEHLEQDHFIDILPEDGELPDQLIEAMETFNKMVDKCPPVSWSPTDYKAQI